MAQPTRDPPVPSSPPEDAALTETVRRAQAGDRAAFTALFQRYNAPICTYLAHLVGDDDLGRDLAQDTFLAAWRALPVMRDASRFTPWLYRIATNLARSHLRRARLVGWLPWAEGAEGAGREPASVPGPEQRAGEAERVTDALAQLGPRCRACLLLQLDAGFSQREIADMLGIAEKSVSAYVSRGREQFRREYTRLECAPEPRAAGGPR